jgi:hypothetical protein
MAAHPYPVFDWLADSVRALGFDAKQDADTFQLLLALGAALVAYGLIHRSQKRAAEESRRIERARLLHDLDREYYDIMSRKSVVDSPERPTGKVDDSARLRLEWLLTGAIRWLPAVELDASAQRRYPNVEGARHLRIAETHYVDTISLHLMLGWSKRVSSGLDLKILSRRDVMEMWRNILPWARGNRFSFMADFFGMSEPRKAGIRKLIARSRHPWRDARRRIRSWFRFRSHGYLLEEVPPADWRGDIAALYHVVRVVIEEALRQDRFEILDYLRASAEAPLWSGMDEGLREALFK